MSIDENKYSAESIIVSPEASPQNQIDNNPRFSFDLEDFPKDSVHTTTWRETFRKSHFQNENENTPSLNNNETNSTFDKNCKNRYFEQISRFLNNSFDFDSYEGDLSQIELNQERMLLFGKTSFCRALYFFNILPD